MTLRFKTNSSIVLCFERGIGCQDTDSHFFHRNSKLVTNHLLIHLSHGSFAWIDFDEDKDYAYDYDIMIRQLYLLQCLCISTETLDIVIYFVKLNEQQLDDPIEFFIDELVDKDKKKIHEKFYYWEYDITQLIMKLKEGQLDDASKCLINRLSDEKEDKNNLVKCAHFLLGKLSMKWNEKQFNDAFNPLMENTKR
ncbi:hypothetical protein RFI_02300 [Reticulomyxa filosa]|uniref:Uncharacterized protein n=1 Tax=Reticulomyxa filosa TaxID=46433 RepID=X6PAX1_RETFI|nr:hypothetical protein RFI_02300 [Reticulomyxa filosa]|eukprot:ETO34787.1 hypothetical protein RFI_02300 [Reticulomyxa filosa]